ncbi:DUF7793 family protein [Arthrobacter sp. TMS1-12-1]
MRDQMSAGPVLPMGPDFPAPTYVVRIEADTLRVAWAPGVTVSDHDAVSLVARVEDLSGGAGVPMLVELNAMVSLSRNALQILAADLPVTAMALVGASIVDYTLADFFIRVHEPAYPVRYFTTVVQAREWLREELAPVFVEQ